MASVPSYSPVLKSWNVAMQRRCVFRVLRRPRELDDIDMKDSKFTAL